MSKKFNPNTADGRWRLTPNHDLILEAEPDKTGLVLKGKITEAGADFLVFKLKTKLKKNEQIASFLKLKGIWRSDRFNRIVFEVKRKINPETLIFGGLWQLNKQQKIRYSYEKINLKTKNKVEHSVVFDGFWQLNQKGRLRYILSRTAGSEFNFRAQIESSNLYPKQGTIKYRLGIGIKKGIGKGRGIDNYREKVISLYGVWKFSRKLGLELKMSYGRNQVKSLRFGAKVKIAKNKDLVFALRDVQNRLLGLTLTFNHRLFSEKELEYFLQAKKTGQDLYSGLGLSLRF